jgi:hypothetical protein
MDLGILVLRLAVPFEVGGCSPRMLVVKRSPVDLRSFADGWIEAEGNA